MDGQILELKKAIEQSHYTVAITGAGISVSAGIGDFEHMNFATVLQVSSDKVLRTAPEHYYKMAQKAFLNAMFRGKSTVTHKKLAYLEQTGRLQGIVTTNIDCLHSLAGSKSVAELQGSFGINKCLSCGKHYDDVFIWNQGKAPKCKVCGGVIAPFPVYEHIGLADTEVGKARDWLSRAELVLIIGTNGPYGNVYFNYIKHGAKIVQINPKHTQFDKIANLNIYNKSDDVFSLL